MGGGRRDGVEVTGPSALLLTLGDYETNFFFSVEFDIIIILVITFLITTTFNYTTKAVLKFGGRVELHGDINICQCKLKEKQENLT